MNRAFAALFVAGFAATASADGADELSPPIHVMVGDVPLDCNQGHAAPCFADFDGDGLPDLVIGLQGEVDQLRLYRNIGNAKQPKFENRFSVVKSGKEDVEVPAGSGITGLVPQLVDLDGDGRADLLTSCASGDLVVFHRNADGTFAPPSKLRDGKGEELRIGGNGLATAFATDWDGDGDFDIILGTQSKVVYVSINEGTREKPAFATPVPLQVDGSSLTVAGGVTGIFVADWDADGRSDLVIGTGSGGVFLYRNVGSAKKPVLNAPMVLFGERGTVQKTTSYTANSPAGREVGDALTPFLVDWNGDGRLDLVFGDVNKPTTTKVNMLESEKELFEMLQTKAKQLQSAIAGLSGSPENESDTDREAREAKLGSLRTESDLVAKRLARMRGTKTTEHGFVWVMFRRPKSTPSAD